MASVLNADRVAPCGSGSSDQSILAILSHPASVRPADARYPAGIRLYTTKTNLRDDPTPQNQAWYQPFLAMISQIGTVEFRRASQAPPGSFDVVIADFCAVPQDAERTILTTHLQAGGRVLVLGDNFCWSSAVNRMSAASANLLLRDFGIAFTTEEIPQRDPLAIAPAEQRDLLAGVSLLSVFRVTPQSLVSGPWTPIVTHGGKVLAAIATIPSGGAIQESLHHPIWPPPRRRRDDGIQRTGAATTPHGNGPDWGSPIGPVALCVPIPSSVACWTDDGE